jgi:hypothetical protein
MLKSERYIKLNLEGFSHVSFVVKSLDESRRFYRDLLGFSEVVRPGSLKERGIEGCWLFNFGVGLHLIEGDPPKRRKELTPEADHFSFQVCVASPFFSSSSPPAHLMYLVCLLKLIFRNTFCFDFLHLFYHHPLPRHHSVKILRR